jgi:hypothetical protein
VLLLLVFVVPTSTLHAALFHSASHHDCGSPHRTGGPLLCDDAPHAQHDDPCTTCAAAKRLIAAGAQDSEFLESRPKARPNSTYVHPFLAVVPRGSGGPRAPPSRD